MRRTVTFVNISDVLSHLQIPEHEHLDIFDVGFRDTSFGDADHTLVAQDYALACILDCLDADAERTEVLTTRFYEIVGLDDFIDLEN